LRTSAAKSGAPSAVQGVINAGMTPENMFAAMAEAPEFPGTDVRFDGSEYAIAPESFIARAMTANLKIGTKSDAGDPVAAFLAALDRPFLGDALFDGIEDTVYFVKDREARYVAVNETLAKRCGARTKAELLGRTAREAFPAPLGEGFERQDRAVIRDGAPIHGRLELHLYPGGRQGWCLTWKEPLADRAGRIVGLCGLSRDLKSLASPLADAGGVSAALGYAHEHLDRPLRIPELAARAGLSAFRFDQRIRGLFGLSAGQYLTRARIERACDRLRQSRAAVAAIAQDCGYADQAAFTRQFHKSVGLTPLAYRRAQGAGGGGN
jgi:AraC-like DNA-binding protein/PAS domain-containing protein